MDRICGNSQRLSLFVITFLKHAIFPILTIVVALACFGDAKSSDDPPTTTRAPSPEEMREGYEHSMPFDLRLGDARKAHDFLKDFLHDKYKKELIGSSIYPDLDKKFLPRYNYIGWKDVNSDGIDELFLYVSVGYYCGSVGCPTHIFQQKNGKWSEIGFLPGDSSIRIGGPVLGGFQTIYAHDACALWRGRWYGTRYDDPQDGDHIDPHACGKNYER